MKKFIVILCLMLACPYDLFAGKSSFSGGSSRPSGGSSFSGGSRSSTSSNRSSGSTFSGGSKSSGRINSSGGRSSFSGGSKSSGSTSSSSWGGGLSKPKPTTTTTSPRADKTPIAVSKKPAAPTFDKLAGADAKKAESRTNYEKSTAPAPSYKTPKGNEVKIDPKDKKTEYIRSKMGDQKWVNRTSREASFYSKYQGPSYPVVIYNDPFHSMLNYWMLSQSINTMAMFIYHHQQDMDQSRIRDLYTKNAKLEAEVAAIKAKGVPVDANWYPPEGDPDLYYGDNYIDAAYNPHVKEITEYTYEDEIDWNGFWNGVWLIIQWLFWLVVAVVAIVLVLRVGSYLLFERRY